ncbi:MAG: DUF1810 domain-containing protein [Leptolyngbyaceae cyanobacterium MO_188.B28]|nr:DUF1810 domain-containing protein [Leptolyngbyaceae cyanobacterium MO_188.B28]
MRDTYNLRRFLEAQNPIYDEVLHELKLGRKRSHWMWYIFPQMKGLGWSWAAQEFAISSLEEAQAYLNHSILGSRLRQCTQLVLNAHSRTIKQIFDYPDHLKFRSSMTLFSSAAKDNKLFNEALIKYFSGAPDPLTLDILEESQGIRRSTEHKTLSLSENTGVTSQDLQP